MMLCLGGAGAVRTHTLSFLPSKRLLLLPRHLPPSSSSNSKPYSLSVKMSSSQSIEHVVLFKVKQDADPSKVNSMVNSLAGLVSLDQVKHLTVGPILRNRSTSFNFTHMLHSRYRSKDDLSAYSASPSHLSVVKESVLPICEDIMAVDWVEEGLTESEIVPPPGSAMRVTFLKLKEGAGDEVKDEILGVVREIKDSFGQIRQLSCGENFSPARAKGFSIASIAIFPGLSEMEALESNEELVSLQKEKVRGHLDSVVVVDYVVPSTQAQSASL